MKVLDNDKRRANYKLVSNYKLVANGDSGLTILFGQAISESLSIQIMHLAELCRKQIPNALIQVIPAYQSLTLQYLPNKIAYTELVQKINLILQQPVKSQPNAATGKIVDIPVCYEPEHGPDLSYVAEHTGHTIEQVIQAHSQPEYFVHMLGFSPGFLYLGGLAPELACPRKSTPALSLPSGSVAIGGAQTGIYPQSSPGGWHVIGRTPLKVFDIHRDAPCIAQPLERIKFNPISADEFKNMAELS